MKAKSFSTVIALAMSVSFLENKLVAQSPTSCVAAPAVPGNLIIANPSMATATANPGEPDGWNEGGNWGTASITYTYPVAGPTAGTCAANVTIANYQSGDAKWYFNSVAVQTNTNYSFSDSYASNTASVIIVQFTVTGTTNPSYVQITILPSTNGAWTTTTQTIATPSGVTALTVFHLIESNGSLTTANFSLVPMAGGGSPTTFSTGIVSLRFDDGWLTHFTNALPILQKAGLLASFSIISNALNWNETIFPNANNPLSAANTTTTSQSVTWSQIYTDPSEHQFTFSDTYTASAPSQITIKYTPANGTETTMVIGLAPAGTKAQTSFVFTLPPLASSKQTVIVHSVTTGTLTASNPLLLESIGYMNTSQMLAIHAAGMGIDVHTMDHPNLEILFTNPNSALIPPGQLGSCCPDIWPLPPSITAQQEIDGGRTALLALGITPLIFAYPYGGGAGDPNIEALIKADGMIAASTSNAGYNTKTTDPFNLNVQIVDVTVMDFATIQAWIDYAAANKVWLILLFHQVETSAAILTANGETYGTTTAILQSTVNYLVQQQAAGKIVVDTVQGVMTKYMQ